LNNADNKKVLLVFPSFTFYVPNGCPPLGIGYIASVLRDSGYDVRILDLTLYRDPRGTLKNVLSEFEPQLVLFSILTTLYPGLSGYLKIILNCAFVKKVIFGGPHPTAVPDEVLKEFPDVIIVRGEGEITIAELLNTLYGGEDIGKVQGISYVRNGNIQHTPPRPFMKSLDHLPFPAFDLMEVDKYQEYLEGKRLFSMVTSRGCPFQCIYCLKATHGQNWVGRSSESIIAEIKHLIHRYNRRAFYFVDDLFTRNEKRVLDFCRLIKEERLDIIWRCLARVDMISENMLKAMYESGCRMIDFGVESCDDDVLRVIKKGYKYDKIVRAFNWTGKIGIKTKAHMMLVLPEDTVESMFRTIERIYDLAPDYVQFNITIPFPATELWTWMDKKGLLPEQFKWNYYQMSNIEQENLTPEEIEELPIYLPPGFTKKDVVELFYISNNLGISNEFRNKFRSNRFRFILSAGRHPIRFYRGLKAKSQYKRFKLKILGRQL